MLSNRLETEYLEEIGSVMFKYAKLARDGGESDGDIVAMLNRTGLGIAARGMVAQVARLLSMAVFDDEDTAPSSPVRSPIDHPE